MKTINKLQFGVNAIQAGQKSATVNATPQLIANSTPGKFVVTAPVTKALSIAAGDTIMFLNNISGVEAAIQTMSDDIKAVATELGVDPTTREGQDAILNACTQWYIAKGVAKFDKTGAPVMTTERFTKEDKAKYLDLHRAAIVEENRAALVEKFGEMSDEELAEKLTVDMIQSPKVQAYDGSKTATTSTSTGVGLQLNFTDSSIWTALKSDLGENASKMNRIYDVLLDEAVEVPYNNGFKEVNIMIAPISFVKDVQPIVREKKAAE